MSLFFKNIVERWTDEAAKDLQQEIDKDILRYFGSDFIPLLNEEQHKALEDYMLGDGEWQDWMVDYIL